MQVLSTSQIHDKYNDLYDNLIFHAGVLHVSVDATTISETFFFFSTILKTGNLKETEVLWVFFL